MVSPRARRLWCAGLGLFAALVVLCVVAVAQRRALAEWAIVRAIAARGVPAQLHVARLGLDGAEIEDLALGDASAPDLRVARASLAWSRSGLRARRLDRIAVRGVRLRARVDAGGLHLGALDALLAGDPSSRASEPLALPFAEAHLEDVEATLDSPRSSPVKLGDASTTMARLRLDVARVGQREAEMVGMSLDDPGGVELRVSRVSLDWSQAVLREQRLDRIAVSGVRVRARLDESGLRLGALEWLLGGDSESNEPFALPFAEAHLEDVEATLDSPQGALALRVAGDAVPEGEALRATLALHGESAAGELDFGGGATVGLASQELAAAGSLRGITPWGSAEGNLRVLGSFAAPQAEFSGTLMPDAEALPIRIDGSIEVAGTASRDGAGALTADARFAVPAASYEETARAVGVSGEVSLRGDVLEVDATASEVLVPDAARFTEVRIDARREGDALQAAIDAKAGRLPGIARLGATHVDARYEAERLSADVRVAKLTELSKPALITPLRIEAKLSGPLERLALTGAARTPGDGFVFRLRGEVAPAAGQFGVAIRVAETEIASAQRQLGSAFPWLADTIRKSSGHVGLEALASYANDELAASGVVALRGVSLETEYATLRGLSGLVSVTDLDPLTTPPGQTLWMSHVDAALPLANGTLVFSISGDEAIEVERSEWALAGGRLLASGRLPLGVEERRVTLGAEGLLVERVLAALDFEGLSGTGSLSGTIPVRQQGATLFVEEGRLQGTQPGVIRYKGSTAEAALRQPQLATVLGALENLEYDELGLTLSGDLADRMDVKLHIRGRNPNFQRGRPVVVNVNVDAPVGSLLRAGTVATSVPDEIEGQVQRFFGREPK